MASSMPVPTSMDSAVLRSCPKCHQRMSSLKHDSHSICSHCRDIVCSLGTRCNECKDWPVDIMQVVATIPNSYVERCMPLTNNSIEGFNNAFFKTISQCHPNIWKSIALLKEETLWKNN